MKKEIAPISKTVRFTAGLRYDESRELVRTSHPGLPDYVGTPTPELDAAWEDLMGGMSTKKELYSTADAKDSGQCICDCSRGAWIRG